MHTRFPTFTFVNDPVYAQTEWEPTLTSPVAHFQGSDVVLEMMLQGTRNEPLLLTDYSVTFFLKKSELADNILFRHDIIEKVADRPDGFYSVTIPARITSKLPPGVYYFTVQAIQKATGRFMPPFRGFFSLELSAASPNPNLGLQDGEPTAIGPGGTADELLIPAEITGPNTPDIGKHF